LNFREDLSKVYQQLVWTSSPNSRKK